MNLDSQIILDAYFETRQQRALERSERLAAIGELAASIAHEVRNPLAGMKGAMEVLREHLTRDPSKAEVVDELVAQIVRLEKLFAFGTRSVEHFAVGAFQTSQIDEEIGPVRLRGLALGRGTRFGQIPRKVTCKIRKRVTARRIRLQISERKRRERLFADRERQRGKLRPQTLQEPCVIRVAVNLQPRHAVQRSRACNDPLDIGGRDVDLSA